MPLNEKARKVMRSMKEQYGKEEGERVFYATANKQNRNERTWEKEKKASDSELAGKCKRALAAYVRYVDDDDREEPSLWSDMLTGAAIGGGAGALGRIGYGGYQGLKQHQEWEQMRPEIHKRMTQFGTEEGMPPPTIKHFIADKTAPFEQSHGTPWAGIWSGVSGDPNLPGTSDGAPGRTANTWDWGATPTWALIGSGVGAALGALRYLLRRL